MIIDLGCGENPERWISGTVRIDNGLDAEFTRTHGIMNIDVEREEWPFPNNSVDEVWSRDGLTGMNSQKVLPEILRVLKPFGRLTVIGSQHPDDAALWLSYHIYRPWKVQTDSEDEYQLIRTNEAVEDISDFMEEPYVKFITVHVKLPIT